MGAHRFEELDVFQRAYKVSLEIHRFTLTMPQIEQFDLASQIRRASTNPFAPTWRKALANRATRRPSSDDFYRSASDRQTRCGCGFAIA